MEQPDFVTAASWLYIQGYGMRQEEGRENVYRLYNRNKGTTQEVVASNFKEATIKAWELVQKEKGNDSVHRTT